jgi:hypothetical protein
MTALQQIIKEAQAIRRKSPKMEWKKAVAQASAIYSSKNKGKKKVVKKSAKKKAVGKYVKTVRKGKITDVIYKRKKIAGVKKKAIRKTATKKAPVVSKHKDTKSHNVNIRVMSGVSDSKGYTISQIEHNLRVITMYERKLNEYKECKKQSKTSAEKSKWTRLIKSVENQIREHKTHIAQLKKHI